jgi:hypothetical protein
LVIPIADVAAAITTLAEDRFASNHQSRPDETNRESALQKVHFKIPFLANLPTLFITSMRIGVTGAPDSRVQSLPV